MYGGYKERIGAQGFDLKYLDRVNKSGKTDWGKPNEVPYSHLLQLFGEL